MNMNATICPQALYSIITHLLVFKVSKHRSAIARQSGSALSHSFEVEVKILWVSNSNLLSAWPRWLWFADLTLSIDKAWNESDAVSNHQGSKLLSPSRVIRRQPHKPVHAIVHWVELNRSDDSILILSQCLNITEPLPPWAKNVSAGPMSSLVWRWWWRFLFPCSKDRERKKESKNEVELSL